MILHLTLHRLWFDEIARGRKTEEYRNPSPYWHARFEPLLTLLFWPPESEIHFRNGYRPDSPFMRVAWVGIERRKIGSYLLRIHGEVYVLKLGAVLELKNWNRRKIMRR